MKPSVPDPKALRLCIPTEGPAAKIGPRCWASFCRLYEPAGLFLSLSLSLFPPRKNVETLYMHTCIDTYIDTHIDTPKKEAQKVAHVSPRSIPTTRLPHSRPFGRSGHRPFTGAPDGSQVRGQLPPRRDPRGLTGPSLASRGPKRRPEHKGGA